jgi:uncharacterized protein (DUF1800 family)
MRSLLHIAAALAALFLVPKTLHAALDLNSDGLPDVWAIVYNVASINPNGDADGDGFTNAEEAAAGTNPFAPNDRVQITGISSDIHGVHLTIPTRAGKRYQVQTCASLAPANWSNVESAHAGIEGNLTVTINLPGALQRYYRVIVSDVDSDGDGVSDWEELQLGLDPHNTHSGGPGGPNDLAAATGALGSTSTFTIYAVDASATEPPAGIAASDVGTLQIRRTGGLRPLTVHLGVSGPASAGTDYTALPATVSFGLGQKTATVTVAPLADAIIESPEAVVVTISPQAGYTVGSPATAAVLIHDRSSANGTGLRGQYYNTTGISGTVPPNLNTATPVLSRIDPTVDFTWTGSPGTGVNSDNFSVRWTGEVLPEFSQVYTFFMNVDDAARVWVNHKLLVNAWPRSGGAADFSGTIDLQAGVRYPIVIEYYDLTGTARAALSWQSANIPTRTVVPQARLFPDRAPQIFGPYDLLYIQNSGSVSYQIAASGFPTSYAAVNLPPGWTIHSTTGLITGLPNTPGKWDVVVNATNAQGTGSAVFHIQVIGTGGAITRDVWNGTYANLGAVPFNNPPSTTGTRASLEGPQTPSTNYGSRLRGYITAPATGAYRFWLTGDDEAELWISDDEEVVNLWRRASLPAATAYREWASGATSPLLHLDAGQRYYVEVRHRNSSGAAHVSVGWLKPGETGTTPSEVVPGYVLSPYAPPVSTPGESTLYVTSMRSQGAAITNGYGTASLQVSADERQAILYYNYSNLTTPVTAQHIHSDPWNGKASQIIFDIDDAQPQQDGSYVWEIIPVGNLSAPELIQIIKDGASYINVHTAQYPEGEIRGNFSLAAGSQTFTPPPPPPGWSSDHAQQAAASRFLAQATFGPSPADIAAVQASGYEAWIDNQFTLPPSYLYPKVFADRNRTVPQNPTYSTGLVTNSWWKASVTAPDQLRQRVAFALSEILVVSSSGVLEDRSDALSDYYDMLLDGAFGNFRDLLEQVTLHPAMGRYLDMWRNDKPNPATGRIPNENYAREILQLFSIGLYRMHPDGSLILSSRGLPIPTYGQEEIIGFAHAFTGWDYFYTGSYRTTFGAGANWLSPMREVPVRHFTGPKRILNNVVLPGLPTLNGQPLDPYANHGATQYNDPAYQALARQELIATHDAIFNHPNVGPFICRQLIQRLVTSTPSRAYIYRVVQKFNDNGSGVRGDMKAVIKAILLDYEARSPVAAQAQGFGKQREPILRVTAVARAFPPAPSISGSYAQNGGIITVTTSSPHRLGSGNNVFLSFSEGTPSAASDGLHNISTFSGLFPVSATQFTVRTLDCFRSSYAQTSGQATLTITTPTGHNIPVNSTGYRVYVRTLTGDLPSGLHPVAVPSTTTLTITMPDTAGRSGTCDVHLVRGGYTQAANNPVVNVTTRTRHGLATGMSVYFRFSPTAGQTVTPGDGSYTITVTGEDTFTFEPGTSPTSGTRSGIFFASGNFTDVAQANTVMNRSGVLGSASIGYQDWTMGSTDTDLGQTPLRSPTVFNFFEPDYQYPGPLASAGLITPEFQISSETNVMRQVNFLSNGVFSSNANTTSGPASGINSFRAGGWDIAVDFGPWMGPRSGSTGFWTDNANLLALIDELDRRLLGGTLPRTGSNSYGNPRVINNARQAIYDFVSNTSNIAYTAANPTETQRRDRIRAVVHLLATSPDFTIQK